MQNNKKFFDKLVSRTKIYLFIILVLLIAICVQDYRFIIPSIVVYILIVIYALFTDKKRKDQISETIEDITITVDYAAKTSLINSPLPLVILDISGKIVWRSAKFVSEFANVDINSYLRDILYDMNYEMEKRKDKVDKSIETQTQIGNNIYKVLGRYVDVKNQIKI